MVLTVRVWVGDFPKYDRRHCDASGHRVRRATKTVKRWEAVDARKPVLFSCIADNFTGGTDLA
jgi:hypothetical protein